MLAPNNYHSPIITYLNHSTVGSYSPNDKTFNNKGYYLTMEVKITSSNLWLSHYTDYQMELYSIISDLHDNKNKNFKEISNYLNDNGYKTPRNKVFTHKHTWSIYTYKIYNESGDLISQQVCKENYLISGFYWEKVLSDKELYEEARKAINETNQMLNCKPFYGKITSVGGSVNDEIQFTLKCPKCKTFSNNKRFRKNKVNTNKSYYKCPSCKKNCYCNPNIMKHMVKGDTF